MRERGARAALVALLLAVGGAGWWLQLRPALSARGEALAEVPSELGPWRGRDVPVEDDVAAMLRADFNLQRLYEGPFGEQIWLYVGYYGSDRGGSPEHTPGECYPAQGWRVAERRVAELDAARVLRANEYVVERDGRRRLAFFWYRSFRGSGILGTAGLALDHALGRLLEGRADGALVRLSTPLDDGDLEAARARMRSLALSLEDALARSWPEEVPRT